MTELRAKNVCPYMGAHPIFDYILALKWSNFNIFTWDLFYMINMHKLHITVFTRNREKFCRLARGFILSTFARSVYNPALVS